MTEKLNYITADDISFYSSEYGLLMAAFKGEDKGRVGVYRMFPLRLEEEYLCVKKENYTRSDKETEIGIIRKISDFPKEQVELIRKELEKRYFVPQIVSVNEVKEEYGHTMWKVQTTAGYKEFTLNDMSTNVRNMGNNKIMLTDVHANRYYIPDITKIDDKATKIIEIWI